MNSIAATTTRTGLTVTAELDRGSYPTGTEISDEQMAAVPLARHRFHGDWNYALRPRPAPPAWHRRRRARGLPEKSPIAKPCHIRRSRECPASSCAS